MEAISLQIPPEIVAQIRLPKKRIHKILMEELVLRLLEEEIVSAGQGAYMLKMERLEFERFMAEHRLSIHCDAEELEQDIACLGRVI